MSLFPTFKKCSLVPLGWSLNVLITKLQRLVCFLPLHPIFCYHPTGDMTLSTSDLSLPTYSLHTIITIYLYLSNVRFCGNIELFCYCQFSYNEYYNTPEDRYLINCVNRRFRGLNNVVLFSINITPITHYESVQVFVFTIWEFQLNISTTHTTGRMHLCLIWGLVINIQNK